MECAIKCRTSAIYLVALNIFKWWDIIIRACNKCYFIIGKSRRPASIHNLCYNSPYGFCLLTAPHRTSPHICVAYLWSLQTEFWADRFTTCLKLPPLTYFLYC